MVAINQPACSQIKLFFFFFAKLNRKSRLILALIFLIPSGFVISVLRTRLDYQVTNLDIMVTR